MTPPGCAPGGSTCYALRRAASACARQQWVVVSKCCGGGARVARAAAWQRRRASSQGAGEWRVRRVSLRIEEELPAVAASKCASGKVLDRQARAVDRLESAEQPQGALPVGLSLAGTLRGAPHATPSRSPAGGHVRLSAAGIARGSGGWDAPPLDAAGSYGWPRVAATRAVLSAHSDGAPAGHAHISGRRSTGRVRRAQSRTIPIAYRREDSNRLPYGPKACSRSRAAASG